MPRLRSLLRTLTSSAGAVHGWRALLALLAVVVAYLALTPLPPRGVDLGWDKLNHAGAFASLALCGWFGVRQRRGRWAMMAALLAYGGLIEVAQAFVPGRASEWADLLADGVGIGVGAAAASLLLALAGVGAAAALSLPSGSRPTAGSG
jgi:VanZ family protein